MALWTVPIVKNSHTLAGIYFIFLKERPRPNSKSCNTKFEPQWKDRENNFHVKQVSTLSRNLVTLIYEDCQIN